MLINRNIQKTGTVKHLYNRKQGRNPTLKSCSRSKVNSIRRGLISTLLLAMILCFSSCDSLFGIEDPQPQICWADVQGGTWYNKSQYANVLNTVIFGRDTIYHWIDTYSPMQQVSNRGTVIAAGQVVSRQLRKGYVYNRGDIYVDGDGEVLYCFNVKWKEYVPETGAPIYDWAVYQVWWLASITVNGHLRWGDFDANDEIQRGWEFLDECPIELDYSWYE